MKSKANNQSTNFEYKIEDLYQSQNFYINHLFDLYGSDKGTLTDKIKVIRNYIIFVEINSTNT